MCRLIQLLKRAQLVHILTPIAARVLLVTQPARAALLGSGRPAKRAARS